ncbi:hypothetical protein FA13DRAFT_346518 [Coprinellus micaceus]|uniref:Uncharacterized protein n=1 Tax=Coprinellus micaceus TaxID=71717 RepID=A0A4Y7SCU0_COPMI|nr:hypothetical protein FA13DRAFT_346518 [Coprinellus micaceus]
MKSMTFEADEHLGMPSKRSSEPTRRIHGGYFSVCYYFGIWNLAEQHTEVAMRADMKFRSIRCATTVLDANWMIGNCGAGRFR